MIWISSSECYKVMSKAGGEVRTTFLTLCISNRSVKMVLERVWYQSLTLDPSMVTAN